MIYYRKRFYPSSARFPRKGYRRSSRTYVRSSRAVKKYTRFSVPRPMPMPNVVHMRLNVQPYFTSPTAVATNLYGAVFTAYISQCWRYQQVLNVFQQYRINKIVTTFTPCTNVRDDTDFNYSGASQVATVADRGSLYVVIDHEDFEPPAQLSDILSYPNVKTISAHKSFTIKYTPSVQILAYQTGGSSNGYSPKYKQWIQRDDYNVSHHGMKYMVSNLEASVGGSGIIMPRWKIQHYFYVSFKNPNMVVAFDFPEPVVPGELAPVGNERELDPVDDSMHAEPDYELTVATAGNDDEKAVRKSGVKPPMLKRGGQPKSDSKPLTLRRTLSVHNENEMLKQDS